MDKLIDCFVQAFAIDHKEITASLAYQSIPQWDSLGHMALVVEIENAFNVTFDADDIIAMSDVAHIVSILDKHGVAVNAAG